MTNIETYTMENSSKRDTKKIDDIDYFGNKILNRVLHPDKEHVLTPADHLMNLLLLEGDVLIINDIDLDIRDFEIMWIIQAIANSKDNWKEIYISGHNIILDQLFITRDRETYETSYNPNYCYIRDNN